MVKPIREGNGPRHVAVIMDGNGRWARLRGRPRLFGHHAGAKRVRELVEACPDLGVRYLTIFAFSTENWKRTQTEVAGLMSLFRRYIPGKHGPCARKTCAFASSATACGWMTS